MPCVAGSTALSKLHVSISRRVARGRKPRGKLAVALLRIPSKQTLRWPLLDALESAQTHHFSNRGGVPVVRRDQDPLRYASGEATRLSIGREGFDLPTERQQGVAQSGPECLSRTQEAVGSNPTTLTIPH